MKLNLGRRIVLFLHWLASLVLLAIIVFPDYVSLGMSLLEEIPGDYVKIGIIALLVVYLLLSISVLCMIFKRDARKSERGFITVDAAETGKVRIAVSAIEQMVKQAAYTVDGIADMKISINNADDAIEIQVNVAMVNGSHVPTVTLNMQRAIRQYVEMNCGVAVRSVSISIQSVTANTDGSKRGKRTEVKPAPAPVQPVQELSVPEAVEPEVHAEPAASAEPEQTEYYAVDTEVVETVAEEINTMNEAELSVSTAEPEIEEEKEN